MIVTDEAPELAALNVSAKPWSPVSSSGDRNNNKVGSGEDDLDDVLRDALNTDENLSWGMQALTGMSANMFPDEDEKSQQTASPALSISPRGKGPLPMIQHATTPPPPPRCWSPTISHTLINSCCSKNNTMLPPTPVMVGECMEEAYKKLKMQITNTEDEEDVDDEQCLVEADDEDDVRKNQYNEEMLLRLHKMGSLPTHDVPDEIFVAKRQDPELGGKYPTLMNPPQNHTKWRKEPCRYYSQGSCRKAECPFYHDPKMYNPEVQAAYEMGMMRQAQMEHDYAILLNDVLQQEMAEKQRDANDGVKSGDRTVYIVGVDSSTSDENILIRLSHFGSIRKYQLCGDPNQPTRYGFFEYNTAAAARGCQTIDCKKMFTRPIRVSKAKDAIKGGRNVPELHQMELLRAAVMCQIQGFEAPCVKGSGRPASILDEPTPPPGKGVKRPDDKSPTRRAQREESTEQ